MDLQLFEYQQIESKEIFERSFGVPRTDKILVECEELYTNSVNTEECYRIAPLRVIRKTGVMPPFESTFFIDGEQHIIKALSLSDFNYKWCIYCGSLFSGNQCCNKMTLWVPETKRTSVDCAIIHGDCSDGMGSLWAIHRVFCKIHGHNRAQSMITSFGAKHDTSSDQKSNTEIANVLNMCKGKNVIIADFAYEPGIILKIKMVCNNFLLLDHHDSNMAMLANEPNCYFDNSHSGAHLTWAWMETGIPLGISATPPKLIAYIEDRDLWKFSLPHSREINAALFVDVKSRLENMDSVDSNQDVSFNELKNRGKIYIQIQNEIIDGMIKVFASKRGFFGYMCAVINTQFSTSDTCERMLAKPEFSDCRVAIAWRWDYKKSQYKFNIRRRESDNDLDLGAISSLVFKGGGHPAAAGFVMNGHAGVNAVFRVLSVSTEKIEVNEDTLFELFKQRSEVCNKYCEDSVISWLKYSAFTDTMFGQQTVIINSCFRPTELTKYLLGEKSFKQCRLCVVFFWDSINYQFVVVVSKRQSDRGFNMRTVFYEPCMASDCTAVLYFQEYISIYNILKYCRELTSK